MRCNAEGGEDNEAQEVESEFDGNEDVSLSRVQDLLLCPTKSTHKMRAAALFILKAKEVRMITRSALDGLLEDVTG